MEVTNEKAGHVVLCPNPHRDAGLLLTKKTRQLLEEAGIEVVLSPIFDADMSMYTDIPVKPLHEAVIGAKLLVTFGGDGTILYAAREIIHNPVPILGVNLGKKGFMAEVMPDELEQVVNAAEGRYTLDVRMMLDVRLMRDGEAVFSESALNDAVINGVGRIINIKAYGDGMPMTEFYGDGIIASTPTGSTAYSISAGGPIVEPSARNILLTPLCAHDLLSRALVLIPERVVTLKLGEMTGRRAILSVDGGEAVEMFDGDVLEVRRSKYETLLAHMEGQSFFHDLRQKFS